MSLLLSPVTMSRILLNHKLGLCFDDRVSVSESLSDRANASTRCSSVAHSKLCRFGTYRRPSLAANFSVLSLTGSTASLSLSLCGEVFLLAAQSTAPSIGGGAGPHRSVCALGQSFVQIGVDGTRFVVVCSTLSRRGIRS